MSGSICVKETLPRNFDNSLLKASSDTYTCTYVRQHLHVYVQTYGEKM